MAIRLKWEVNAINRNDMHYERNLRLTKETILDLIDSDLLTTHFQPVFFARDGSVFGFEALTRIKESPYADYNTMIGAIFTTAIESGIISILDVKCRENAMKIAHSLGITQSEAMLFINISPDVLMDPAHRVGITDQLAELHGIPKERIVLEITEEMANKDFTLFAKAVSYYKGRGYRIAIDDFGSGYGGLKFLSGIEPDFVKIDHHFISNVDKATVKYNIIDSVVTLCHRMGIRTIAEGIEVEEELKTLMGMGVDFLQGFYLARPSPILEFKGVSLPKIEYGSVRCCAGSEENCLIGELSKRVVPLTPEAPIVEAFDRFMADPNLRTLPVVKNNVIVGVLERSRFLENNVLGRFGYGIHLNARKHLRDIMEKPTLIVESDTTLEEVTAKIQLRPFQFLYDDICVSHKGVYYGMVDINTLLNAITQRSIILAKQANPLTGLPGNEAINREINKRLLKNMHFDVCYIDINNFKPYNDRYGFEKGDMVIKTLAEIVAEVAEPGDTSFNFVGHIGGDDFIVISPPQISIQLSEMIISKFHQCLPLFHDQQDFENGYYVSKNRKNEEERFGLLSISIAIVSTEVHRITSFAQLASIATEVKRAAKIEASKRNSSAIVRDRRLMGS